MKHFAAQLGFWLVATIILQVVSEPVAIIAIVAWMVVVPAVGLSYVIWHAR